MEQPIIAFFDEVLNGLDPDSKRKVKKMLKEHLPKSLILMIDHETSNNSHDNFYNGGEIHFFKERSDPDFFKVIQKKSTN